ncbi:ferric reductase-like transmembrane domain-containing protein [Streptomyces sp. NPDC059743]|uniref:ferredoxin reductase family protein n=1 Tax=Streptomyces sp. NPDC059743 TaxID=3346928 RepID=UPI0036475819
MAAIHDGAGARSRPGPVPGQRSGASLPEPAVLVQVVLWAGLIGVLALWWFTAHAVIGVAGWMIGAGDIFGMVAGYTCALLVLLMARIPYLEHVVGSDRVARWHAKAGRYTITLLVFHVVFEYWGSALERQAPILSFSWQMTMIFPYLLPAAIGGLLLFAVGVVSASVVRRRVLYEVWYFLHLTTYVALFLTFGHQLALGASFTGTFARACWFALYLSAAAAVLYYRVFTPIRRNLRHRLRVESVTTEAPGTYSVLVRGSRLDELAPRPGQFFRWRFLTKGLRLSANPYSLSGAPGPDLLRITVKQSGDHSARLAHLRPGTRVWAEGPYGALTAARQRRGKVLLLAGGVGITPLRTLFETLPAAPGDLTMVYLARSESDLVLRAELEAVAASRGGRLRCVVDAPGENRPSPLTASALSAHVDDLAVHDVYLCGPPGMMEAAWDGLRTAGVPARHIHHESFTL